MYEEMSSFPFLFSFSVNTRKNVLILRLSIPTVNPHDRVRIAYNGSWHVIGSSLTLVKRYQSISIN